MRTLVTGGAGFIGATLCRALAGDWHPVRAIDCFTPYYDLEQKRANVATLPPGVELIEADLGDVDLDELLDGIDVVFHLAGQPGVRLSWSDGFVDYERLNVLVTQRLLEAARSTDLRRFVFASSSSVYGNAAHYPTTEDQLPRPHSPYGVTKLAAEHLCGLYAEVHGVPTVSLRYFTVYGPGQRPDMLMHRLFEDGLAGRPVPIFGTGEQVREFTHVSDVVRATRRAGEADVEPGTVVNVAGGSETTVNDVVEQVGQLIGHPLELDRQPSKPGDVARTGGSIERAQRVLGWSPQVSLAEGLASQWEWHRTRAR